MGSPAALLRPFAFLPLRRTPRGISSRSRLSHARLIFSAARRTQASTWRLGGGATLLLGWAAPPFCDLYCSIQTLNIATCPSSPAVRSLRGILRIGFNEEALRLWAPNVPPPLNSSLGRGIGTVWCTRGQSRAPVGLPSGRSPLFASLPAYDAEMCQGFDNHQVVDPRSLPRVRREILEGLRGLKRELKGMGYDSMRIEDTIRTGLSCSPVGITFPSRSGPGAAMI